MSTRPPGRGWTGTGSRATDDVSSDDVSNQASFRYYFATDVKVDNYRSVFTFTRKGW